MIQIQNNQLQVKIDPHGAQLSSIKATKSSAEYLWQGDDQSWDRQAPILFPFVGRLKDDQYQYNGKSYHQTKHGFARDSDFKLIDQTSDAATFQLQDSPDSLTVYPFKFTLNVRYSLSGNQLNISYQVFNPDQQHDLLYSIGAHPGFHIPLADDHYEDYQLDVQPAKQYSLSMLIGSYNDLGTTNGQQLDLSKPLPINHQLFKDDVLTLITKGSPIVLKLWNPQNGHGVQLDANDTQYVGLWSSYPNEGDFMCLEPWWGIADNINADGQLVHKQGIHRLSSEQSAHYGFSVTIF